MAEPDDRRNGAPSHIHIDKKRGPNWLPWLLLALGLLALLFALSRCGREETARMPPVASPAATNSTARRAPEVVAATPDAATSAVLTETSGLGVYLAGSEPTPRTFTFEKLNFDTGKSDMRAADAAEIGDIAESLAKHPSARVRIAGYADARGAEPVNVALGKARADSVKSALVTKGIGADRIETVSGGENDPVDTNASAKGRFENRRTELVVTAR